MTADVEVGDLEPQIKTDVVHLASLVSLVLLTARTSDKEELLSDDTD